jgi:hypothetical protein
MKRDRSGEQRTPYHWVVSVSVMALMGIALVSWSGPPRGLDLVSGAWADDAHHQNDDEFGPTQTLPISLHGTKQGHATFYSEEYGGFETVTGIPFREGNIGEACMGACHIPDTGCEMCHTDPATGAVPSDANELDGRCLGCHGRQGLEAQFRQMGLLTDVHYDSTHKEFHCMTCHTKREMHGDENAYSSLLAPEAMDAKCTNCHPVKKLRGDGVNAYHAIHLDEVDCSACHVQSVLVCQSCHFDSLVESQQQVFWGPTQGFKLLVQHDGKVHAATYMTLTDEKGADGRTFVVIAPNHVHAVTSGADLSCRDCHYNAAVQKYIDNKPIDVVTWDDSTNPNLPTLKPRTGIIPVPPDWRTALQFDFVVPEQNGWVKLQTGADQSQILFAKPLSQKQMKALSTPRGSP